MTDKTPKSELLRDWINQEIDNEVDLSTPFKRKESFKRFLDTNKDWESQKSDISLVYNIWKRECKKKGIDLRALGIKDPKIFTKNQSSSINATITPKPKQIEGQAPTHENPQQNQPQNKLVQVGQVPQQQIKIIEHTKEEVKELAKGLWYGLKIKWPDLEDLDDEELDIIAGSFKPICDRHMQGDISFYLLPVLVAFGIGGGKIRKARQIKKEREAKEKKQQETQEEKQDGKETIENQS